MVKIHLFLLKRKTNVAHKINLSSSANPVMEIQQQTLMLGSNMSSGVTVPNFGKKFAKLRQCEQFEVQENSYENKASA